MTQLIETISDWKKYHQTQGWRGLNVGFVPTMGFCIQAMQAL